MICRIRHFLSAALLVALIITTAGSVPSVSAQQRAYRATDQQVRLLLRRIESRSTLFRQSLEAALYRNRFDRTRPENNIIGFVRDFEASVARFKEYFDQRRESDDDAREVLNRAAYIDGFMRRQSLTPAAEGDWIRLRLDLNLLARYYNVVWHWDNQPYSPGSAATRLTGTYRLDAARSDSASRVASEATRGLPLQQSQRLRRIITRRLESPEMIAIERNGRRITMASTRAPQITFEADGRDRIEQIRPGRYVRVNAALYRDQLVISSIGDRVNDYRVSFDPIDGQRLRVTRRIDIEGLTHPVTVNSIYDKTSEIAQLNFYPGTIGAFMVPDGTQIVATLNERLTTSESREGDRFSLTVQSPSYYQGAVIEGYVSKVDRGGRLTGRSEIAMNFERIRLLRGATYDFDGYVESAWSPDGKDIRVDNEGVISEKRGQTSRTLTRTGIGAAIGALIGAIASGTRGAAIGAAIGAGAGAGSVFIQGRDDLVLMSGARLTIRASVPRYREEP
ncbi:MAG: hypothetical protein AB1631_15465 [Acidobacteriota bacterium]